MIAMKRSRDDWISKRNRTAKPDWDLALCGHDIALETATQGFDIGPIMTTLE
jgi:hypothetical protein